MMFEVVKRQLTRTNVLILTLATAQAVFSFAAVGFLALSDVDGAWVRALGLAAAALGTFDGVMLVASRSRCARGIVLDLIMSATCVIMSVGIVGLVFDVQNRDRASEDSMDAAERGLCSLILAWGLFLARLGADAVEREARIECSYELRFDP